MKKREKNPEQELQKSKTIFLVLFLLLFAVVIIVSIEKVVLSSKKEGPGSYLIPANLIITEDMTQEEVDNLQTEIEDLSKMAEASRMKYYITKYIGYIEKGEYEKAYDILYPEFKNTYFPTLEQYKTYVQKKYSNFVTTSYEDMQRQGNIYIFFVQIQDLLNPTNQEKNFSQKFIVQEQEINKFVISFEVVE